MNRHSQWLRMVAYGDDAEGCRGAANEIDSLQSRLDAALETIRALRKGEVEYPPDHQVRDVHGDCPCAVCKPKRCSYCDHWAVVPDRLFGERCGICEREGLCISVDAVQNALAVERQSPIAKFVHSSPEEREAIGERVIEGAIERQLSAERQNTK